MPNFATQNEQARFLCADALEQLAYMAESFLWRDAYLTGAAELRTPGLNRRARDVLNNSVEDITAQMPPELILAKLGIATFFNTASSEPTYSINFFAVCVSDRFSRCTGFPS